MPENEENLFRRQLAQFFEATSDAIVILNREYELTFLNRRARELLAPSGEVLGTNLFESFPAIAYAGSPLVESYRRTMEQGEAQDFEIFYPAPLEKWLRIQSYPTDVGIMVFFRDITPEKKARESLELKTREAERQRAEIETVYRTAPIGLALFDTKDFRYLRLNDRQAAFFGLKPEEIVGKTLTEMAPIEGLKELFDQVLRGEPVVNYPLEGELITDPGNIRYWTVSYFPVYGVGGAIQAITAASLEITQQKKAEQALIESEKLAVVGRMASSIAHEINNPLEAVTNLLFLARHSDDMEDVQQHLDLAEIELRRVAAITSQTLRFHRQGTSPQAVTAEGLIGSVLSTYQGRIMNSRALIEKRFRAEQQIRCFEGEIRQVLINLVSNAIDAMKTEGTLALRTRLGRNWTNGESGVVITVADSGQGMSGATLAKLFSPFFTTKGHMGTGLGLWVSKEIMERHRGLMRVRSSESEKYHGTTFYLFLPFDAVERKS